MWDPMLRKFQARDNGQPGTKLPYAVEEMTFEVEEETIPTYDPPSEVSLNVRHISTETRIVIQAGPQAANQHVLNLRTLQSDAEENEELNGRPEDYHGYEDTIVAKASTSTSATSAPAQAPGMGAKVGKGTKRGAEEVMDRIAEKQKRAKEQAEAQKQWFDLKVNTSVYVTGLPDDITEVQLAEVRCFPCQRCVVRFATLVHCYDDQSFGSAKKIATVQQSMACDLPLPGKSQS